MKNKDLKTVLIVEDEPHFRKIFSMMIKKLGHDVDLASNGFQGMQMVEENKYDLIILDHLMPNMTGLELLMLIRHYHSKKDLPIMVLTSCIDKDLIESYLENDVNDFLIKEANLNPLQEKVIKFIGKASH